MPLRTKLLTLIFIAILISTISFLVKENAVALGLTPEEVETSSRIFAGLASLPLLANLFLLIKNWNNTDG